MRSRARGVLVCCSVLLTLSCGQSAESGPGAGGVGGALAGSGGSAGSTSGAGGAGAGAGGKGTGGSAGGGAGGASGGSAGNAIGGAGAANGGDAGSARGGGSADGGTGTSSAGSGGAGGGAGNGGAAGASAGAGGSGNAAGFPPFTAYTPRGATPIELDGIVNASDIAWKPSTDTFFVLTDRTSTFHEYSADFTAVVRTITLVNPPVDAEGLAYLGEVGGLDRFAVSVEANDDEVLIVDLDPAATALDFSSAVVQTYIPGAEPPVANKGWEGVAFRPAANGEPAWLWACQEGEPGQVPTRVVGFPYLPGGATTLSYADDSLAVEEPWDAAETLYADDLSGMVYDGDTGTLLVLSDLSSRLLRVAPDTGETLDALDLTRSPQYEGVTLASGRIVLVSEPNWIEIFELTTP